VKVLTHRSSVKHQYRYPYIKYFGLTRGCTVVKVMSFLNVIFSMVLEFSSRVAVLKYYYY